MKLDSLGHRKAVSLQIYLRRPRPQRGKGKSGRQTSQKITKGAKTIVKTGAIRGFDDSAEPASNRRLYLLLHTEEV